MSKRGLFIVFEGLDRAGKTTQTEELENHLCIHTSIRRWRFPEYAKSPTGALLRSYLDQKASLDNRTQHLLFCANRAEWASTIPAILAQGSTIICDRYVYSGVAYSAAKGLDVEWCKAVEADLPQPDFVFYLAIDPADAALRHEFGDQRHDDIDLLTKVAAQYEALAAASPEVFVKIDASRPKDAIASEIAALVDTTAYSTADPIRPIFNKQ